MPIITAHGLRHTAATALLNEKRLNLKEVQEMIGHKNISTTARYPVLTESLTEVLGCVHLNQPIWQAQIDRYFDADKRAQIMRLQEIGLVEAIRDDQGRHQYITT